MKQYDGLVRTSADYILKFWTGTIGVLVGVLVLAAPALIAAQSLDPSLIPYVKLAVPCLVLYVMGITMTREEDEVSQPGDYNLQVFLIFTITNALYLSSVVLLGAALASLIAPFSAATFASMGIAVLYPYLDMVMLQKLPISPVAIPVFLVALVLVKVTPTKVDLRDVLFLGSMSQTPLSPSS